MCQTLFFIPKELAGWPVFGPGLLLAIWAVASVILLGWLVWRQGFSADTWSYLPILLLIGAIIRWVLPALSESQGLPIRGYGVMIMLAVIAAVSLAAWRARRVGLDAELVYSLAFWMLLPGIIGARAFYVIEYWPEYARAYTDPDGGLGPFLGGVINVAKGGLVVYGAFFGGVAGLLLFIRKHRLPLLALADLIAPSLALGLAIGRIGCLMNGCCFGAVCDYPWAVTFPAGIPPEYTPPYRAQVERGQMYGLTLGANADAQPRVRAVRPDSPAERAGLKPGDRLQSINHQELATTGQAYWALIQAFGQQQPLHIRVADRPEITLPAVAPPPRSLPVHPTQLYSVIDGLMLCLMLLVFDRFRRRDGALFALLISIYPITRFFIESLRTDEAAIFGTGMSISQNVSLLLLVCAAALWFYILRQPPHMAFSKEGAYHGDTEDTERREKKKEKQSQVNVDGRR
jgi:phosphatidylglycerol---prolipoprotein diacylglyceryl transferase